MQDRREQSHHRPCQRRARPRSTGRPSPRSSPAGAWPSSSPTTRWRKASKSQGRPRPHEDPAPSRPPRGVRVPNRHVRRRGLPRARRLHQEDDHRRERRWSRRDPGGLAEDGPCRRPRARPPGSASVNVPYIVVFLDQVREAGPELRRLIEMEVMSLRQVPTSSRTSPSSAAPLVKAGAAPTEADHRGQVQFRRPPRRPRPQFLDSSPTRSTSPS